MIVLKIIDLFSGVGGLSLGAARAGFDLCGSVELDSRAINTHEYNFPNTRHLQCDISKLSGQDLKEQFEIKKEELTGLIGGPPCQGFSPMGKQNINDPRNLLFVHFFRLVNEIKPLFFLAENVPGILNEKYGKIRSDAFKLVKKDYHILAPLTLNAQNYGAPTSRSRVFFIGFRKEKFDAPGSELFNPGNNIINNYVKDAFCGLPVNIDQLIYTKIDEQYWCKVDKTVDNSYVDKISKIAPNNIGNQEAIYRYKELSEVTGMVSTRHSKEVLERYTKLIPGKSDPISRSYRLELNGFCPTLRAGTDQDHGSFQAVRPIHPSEGRVITPREGARLQGFPDWFVFHPTKWHSFRQIGNSVSPIIAEYILKKVHDFIQNRNLNVL
jgi:DNA (cytosine-5)-methyltransferase 1